MSHASATTLVRSRLAAVADPAKAAPMAAYMKTDMPFYGVEKKLRVPILRELVTAFPPLDRARYRSSVLDLWALPHREEKYLALGYARSFPSYIDAESMGLYQQLIVEGAWWDLVDEAAAKLVGGALNADRQIVTPVMRAWSTDPDMWLRRTSIICQLDHKDATDTKLLADACRANIHDTEFFVRKAIGWSLRQYARTDAEWVRDFVREHRDEMSGLSVREAMKHL